jgi:hypothetical protein
VIVGMSPLAATATTVGRATPVIIGKARRRTDRGKSLRSVSVRVLP